MLKVRVIPTLLEKNVGLVKGVGFDSWRRVGSVLPAIKVYNTRDVDELILLDIASTLENRRPDFESVKQAARECFVPFTVGGGVASMEDIQELLRAGADRVCINSASYSDPELIRRGSLAFGAQCIVASIDAKLGNDGQYECFSHSGSRSTGKKPANWAKEVERLGAGEILITSIEKDGTMDGYDLDLIEQVAAAVSIPVIASGGAGNFDHMYQALHKAKADAVAAASIFHFTEKTPAEAKRYLADLNVPVRNAFIRSMSAIS